LQVRLRRRFGDGGAAATATGAATVAATLDDCASLLDRQRGPAGFFKAYVRGSFQSLTARLRRLYVVLHYLT